MSVECGSHGNGIISFDTSEQINKVILNAIMWRGSDVCYETCI